jgi:hypothetical protein
LKKRLFFSFGRVDACIDRFLCYATSEERNLVERLSVPAHRVQRIAYHADQRFFRPFEAPPEPDLICSAGQLLRDYPTLIEAVRGAPVRLRIAAGSPWIAEDLKPGAALPSNVEWGKYSRFDLRALYARAAVCVVPIQENDYQTGISTIPGDDGDGQVRDRHRTRGQTDTLVDGVNGIYVPPGDPPPCAPRSSARSTGRKRPPASAPRPGATSRRRPRSRSVRGAGGGGGDARFTGQRGSGLLERMSRPPSPVGRSAAADRVVAPPPRDARYASSGRPSAPCISAAGLGPRS